MAWICDKNGQQKCEVKQLSYNGTFMEVSSITVTVESPSPIAFAIGDYIDWDYDGLRYTLDTAAGVEKQARKNSIGNAFIYENLVFLSPLNAAKHTDFLDVVLGNTNDFLTNTEFSFYGTAWDYAKRLEANLCRVNGSGTWKVRIWTGGTCYDETPATDLNTGSWENMLVDVSGIKCLDGLQQIYDLWGCAYVFSVVSGVNYVDFYDDFEQYAQAWQQGGIDKIFAYGKGNGLYKIRHTQDADHVLVTRLRAYGSGENIPANYYLNSPDYHVDGNESSELAISNLMLPASQWTKDNVKHPSNAYLEQNTNLYGVREAVVIWDGSDSELGEIKPTIYGLTIQDLLDLMASGTAYRPDETKWLDTTQRIDKIITGAAPTDNGVIAEAGYDFTVVESQGAYANRDLDDAWVNTEVKFDDLVMGTTPFVSHLAEYRVVKTSASTKLASFDLPEGIVSRTPTIAAYVTPYVNGQAVENATVPCYITEEVISSTVGGENYTKRINIYLVDATNNPIVFATMWAGQVTFRIRATIKMGGSAVGFNVIRKQYSIGFKLLRGNKEIDKFFSVTIPQIGFDLAAAVSGSAKLCMRSGANQPREFQIVPSSVRYVEASDTWYLRCKRSVDTSTNTYFPNSDAVIATGDEYYLAGIAMPALYVEIAAQKLLSAATAWLELHSKPRMLSSVDVDNKIMAVEGIVLREGMSLPLSDTDLGITPQNQESRIIDNIRIEEGSDAIRTFTINLRDKKEKSSLTAAIRGATRNYATNTSVSDAISNIESRDHESLSGRDMPNQHPITAITGLEEALAAMSFFEMDGNGNVKLKDEYGGLWANGFGSFGGLNPGGGGGGGIDLDRVWESLTNNTDKPNVEINAHHIPIGSGLAINVQTGKIYVQNQGTVTRVDLGTTHYSPVNGIVSLPAYPTVITAARNLTDGDDLSYVDPDAGVEVVIDDPGTTGTVLWGAESANNVALSVNGTSKMLVKQGALDGIQSTLNILQGYFMGGAARNAMALNGHPDTYFAAASSVVLSLGGAVGAITLGSGLSMVNGQLSVVGQTQGTVTRIDLGTAQYSPNASGVVSLPLASSITQGDNTNLVTGGVVYAAINTALSSAIKYQGVTTTVLTDGATTNPITIDGDSYTAKKGDEVIYGGREFLWTGSKWQQLGDEESWALKTIAITAGTGLSGGGDLTANRTLSLSSATQASLALADSALQSYDLYDLVIKNSAGTTQITYKPAVSATYALTLTKAMVGLSNVENTKLSTWTGSTNITTLGTITAGTWNGTSIAANKLAIDLNWSNVMNTATYDTDDYIHVNS